MTTKKQNKIGIFDFLKSITVNKKDLSQEPSFHKDYSTYMINRWLAMSDSLYAVTIAMYLSTLDMNKESHYKFLLNDFPKGYVKFNYAKKKNEHNKDLVNLLSLCYNISNEKALEILNLNLLSESQIEMIKKSYEGENEKRC